MITVSSKILYQLDFKITLLFYRFAYASNLIHSDMHQFGEINTIYGKYFEDDFPARETVQVSALPKFVNVEISMIAMR